MNINPQYVLREIAGSWVIFQLEAPTGTYPDMLTLNETAAFLWQCLEQGKDRESLITALTDEYEVSREQAAADVDEFIKKLDDIGCILH